MIFSTITKIVLQSLHYLYEYFIVEYGEIMCSSTEADVFLYVIAMFDFCRCFFLYILLFWIAIYRVCGIVLIFVFLPVHELRYST